MGGSLEILKNVIFSNLVVYLGAHLYGQLRLFERCVKKISERFCKFFKTTFECSLVLFLLTCGGKIVKKDFERKM